MRPEINKIYRCSNGRKVRIDDVYPDHAYGMTCDADGRNTLRIRYDLRGCPISEHHGFTLSSLAEPELMFSFKRPRPDHSRTVTESELCLAIQDARLHPHSPRYPDLMVLADAAERMIEQAKACPHRDFGSGPSGVRGWLEDQLLMHGLDPNKYLKPSPSAVHYTKEIDHMCQADKIEEANRKAAAASAAADLAKMLREDLGVEVTPILLRLWLNERWASVAKLAHKIHGG